MTIGVQGDTDTGMTEPLRHDLRGHTLFEQYRGVRVPEAVWRDPSQAGTCHQRIELLPHVRRVHRRALRGTHNQVMIVPRGCLKPALVLCPLVVLESRHGASCQFHGPRAGAGFRAALDNRLALADPRPYGLHDVGRSPIPVHILPAQAERLPPAHAFQQQQVPAVSYTHLTLPTIYSV